MRIFLILLCIAAFVFAAAPLITGAHYEAANYIGAGVFATFMVLGLSGKLKPREDALPSQISRNSLL